MAITVVKERERATGDSADVPYWVSDPTLASGTELDRAMAVTAVLERALIDEGVEAVDYDFDRTSHKSAIVRVRYQDADLNPFPLPPVTPPEMGSVIAGFNAVSFKPTRQLFSLGNVWRKGVRTADGPAPNFRGLVDVQDWRGTGNARYGGYVLELPPETHQFDYVIPNGEFTDEYQDKVGDLLWKVHGGPGTFFRQPPGQVMLVRAQARQRTNEDLLLSFGFSKKKNGHRKIGDIDTADLGVPEPEGHDLLWAVMAWELETVAPGIVVEVPYARWVYNEQIWERGDLNELGMPGSTD